ncbi:hypothetical protein C5B96_09690 [Subtercola sp. Z020]|uniref:glycosyltransferase n=1 Tax=Subtercola sp. Z020 TaxID=2080582 RepID=UPI000CE782BC|nr:glycosyltransferase [Subtercola sp. Z020]PPF82216.1 hypothetical protein C5B96_09690 [Subtercola sp. Z020]
MGGAEFALFRMLQPSPPWEATLFVPTGAGLGLYAPLATSPSVCVRKVGPPQLSGASTGSGIRSTLTFALRALGQSLAIRLSPEFRAADVVHTNTSRAAVYSAVASLLSRKKLVVHLRDLVNAESLGGIGFRLFTRVALRRADGVIANSRATLESALPYLRASVDRAVIASAAGISVSTAPTEAEPELRRIGMVARLDPWKGQDLLVRAFADAFPTGDVRLELAGSAAFGNEFYEEELRALVVELGIADRVDFLGHVDDVAGLIASWQVCLHTAMRPEPLGQNVLQYLASGRATIAVNAGGPAEWITPGENGLLFEMGSREGLADALRTVAGDADLRARLGDAARQTPGLLSDAGITTEHAQFFARVAGARSHPAASTARPDASGPRICFVAAPLTARSGVYRSSREIVAEGRRQGHDWSLLLGVAASASGSAPASDADEPWISEIEVNPAGLKGPLELRALFATHPLVADSDLVVSLIPQSDMAMAQTSKPWVAYIRGLPWPAAGESGTGKTLVWKTLERTALRRAAAVWVTTDVLAADVGLGSRAQLVPAGIQPLPRLWDGRGERRTAVWAARYDQDKNPSLFLAALAGTDLQGVMYGSGRLRDQLAAEAPANVSVDGWTTPDALWEGALAYVGTSHREAFGRSAVEAAMSGIPLVLADTFGAAPLLITDPDLRRRFMLPTSDTAAWTRALVDLAADEALRMRLSDHVYGNAQRLTMAASVAAIAGAAARAVRGPSGTQR